MPLYMLTNKLTGDKKDVLLSMSEKAQYLKENPQWEDRFWENPIKTVSGHGDHAKESDGFKEVMSKIAEQNPHSPLADKYGNKSGTDVKTRDAVKKAGR